MLQLIENKRNHPVLIANFEPNEIATKSGQKTKIQTRKHCADEPAQKVKVRTREHRAGEAAQKVEIQTRRHCAGEAAQKVTRPSRADESDPPGLLFFGGGGCGGAVAYDFEDGFGILCAVVVNLFAEMGDEGAGWEGTVLSGSNFGPVPTHQVPEMTVMKRSLGCQCGWLM